MLVAPGARDANARDEGNKARIKVLCSIALQSAMDDLIPEFERSSGHKVTIDYANAGPVADRVQRGEAADVVISTVSLVDRLQAQGKVMAGALVVIARVGVGVFVRRGASKPDLSSAEAFKRSVLAARSIAYPDPAGGGASGIYMASLIARLGIAAEIAPRTKLAASAEALFAGVASGEVDLGFNQISEILAQPSIELAGPLPADIQNYTQFTPGIVAGSSQAEAGRALIRLLSSPAAQTVLKAKGFD
ncbi:substrate-binding domain-containing protein [Belnapia sp. T18]|uniref:Substrate-binding domain-containing protein n=1 Tax=Belnapia arida TaxID=2804533 RepID=A0ABS1UB68_9PROT|nr:substrate-binding domain-containing protein [Belnapia arida]MBL6081931.1 substrate-binding domain-containing protein [Belnapia arida]